MAKSRPTKSLPPREAPIFHRRSQLGRGVRRLAYGAAVVAVWGVIALGGLVAWYALDLPDIEGALARGRAPTVRLLAADGRELAAVGDLYGVPVRLGELPPALPAAVLSMEDRRFYNHFGIDLIGLARAAVANAKAGRIVQGGSTITQQVAKNLFLTPQRTLKRKVQELLLALWLEHRLTKDQILTVYLNRVYLGAGTYGVEAAARRYFGKSARRVTTYQAALLAGLLKAPSRYSPARDPGLAARRARAVLDVMVAAGVLTPAQAATAKRGGGAIPAARLPRRQGRHFVDWVLEQVSGYISAGDRDLVVKTTLDGPLQRTAEAAVGALLEGPGTRAGAAEAALVVLSPDGAVRAMVGGRDYATSQFNRATQARRQPGSAFKPFVYLAGLEAGLTPDSIIEDAPVTMAGWSPRNFDKRYRGPMTLRQALARSVNTAAVRVARKAGIERVAATARRLGIGARLTTTPSLALGAAEVGLLELTAAYGPFANGGFGLLPYAIEEISDAAGRVLYRRAGSGLGRVVAAPRVAAMNDMLSVAVSSGTGRAARLARPVAGKTGTSQDFRDAWFVGYSADLVGGVWIGNDDGHPMRGVTGGGLPARLWRRVMKAAHRGWSARSLPGLGTSAAAGDDDQQGFWESVLARFASDAG
ncbi:MAG: PBP1A family penicillin-binding protein [Rhodospirillales bacterium]|jgi:penicillin-binding protein 1A|nr:PBP1A family penicillin-binding protein [Rhodospirillales bacterium]MDP6774111.1 PBP1A family penicillin-binding protein [Rhodospirillales bacterium]